jgi:peptide chain release factor 1
VQRVPATEAQGRIHTSACTVAILPELEEIDRIDINPADLRIDTYRSSGAGGQHVNKTESAIRITHICRPASWWNARTSARSTRTARGHVAAEGAAAGRRAGKAREQARRRARASCRSAAATARAHPHLQFPAGPVTDHRINLTLYKLAAIMNGDHGRRQHDDGGQ